MTKKILAMILMLSLHTAHALDIDHVTRESLLASTRLHEIVKESVAKVSEAKLSTLKAQFKALNDGESITIPNGRYDELGHIVISANNVTIKAETVGMAWMTGSVQFEVTGDNVSLNGLVFAEGGPSNRDGGVVLSGDNNTLQNSTFYYFNDGYIYKPDEKRQEYPKYAWLTLSGKQAKVINNRFEGKLKRGNLLAINKDETPDFHLIEHNIFIDMKSNQFNEFENKDAIRYNSNSWETLRIGNSYTSTYPSKTRINENLVINMDGENELMTLKSGGNTISGNTIFSSAGLISLRHGKANHVENNIILGNKKPLTGGIRVFDTDHVITNNYIANTRGLGGKVAGNADIRGAIVINTGIIDVIHGEKLSQETKGKELKKQWTPQNVEVSNNSVIDAQWGFIHGNQVHRVSLYDNSRVEGIYGGDNIHFSNNLIRTTDTSQIAVDASSEFPLTNSTYENEIYGGKVISADKLSNFVTTVPNLKVVEGFKTAKGHGADVKKLHVITADIAGPNYEIK